MADLTFHSMPDSAYLWTAMLVADEKGIAYRFAPLVYRSKEHLERHPFGKMPVMQHGDVWLYETAAIAHYIDKAFDGPPLQPATPLGQANVTRWISIVNSYVFPIMNRFMKERLVRPAWGFDPDLEFIQAAREPLLTQMQEIDRTLSRSDYLVGHELTLADCFLLPHLLFFAITPEGRRMLDGAPGAKAWLGRMMDRASTAKNPLKPAFAAMSENAFSAKPALWEA
jgi:glutathione S-transferase